MFEAKNPSAQTHTLNTKSENLPLHPAHAQVASNRFSPGHLPGPDILGSGLYLAFAGAVYIRHRDVQVLCML